MAERQAKANRVSPAGRIGAVLPQCACAGNDIGKCQRVGVVDGKEAVVGDCNLYVNQRIAAAKPGRSAGGSAYCNAVIRSRASCMSRPYSLR